MTEPSCVLQIVGREVLCGQCSKRGLAMPGILDEECPYAAEINGDHDPCPDNCCGGCRNQCSEDI